MIFMYIISIQCSFYIRHKYLLNCLLDGWFEFWRLLNSEDMMMEGINRHGKTKCSQKLFDRSDWSISHHHTSKNSRKIISHFENTSSFSY